MLSYFSRGTTWLLASLLALAAGTSFYFSLNHPITADLAMLHYSAWLINEKHFVLYRDIFDINFPAPYLFHSLLGKILGYEALPLRWVDFSLMAALGWASWKILSPLSKPAAIFGFSIFCLLYWINGGEFVLERDVLALVPAAIAFALACDKEHPHSKIISIGAFAAIACSMKPNTIVIVPVLLWMLYSQAISNHKKLTAIPLFLIAMIFVSLTPFFWISINGGLDSFFDIYRHYMPIYANSRYDLYHYENSTERWTTLLAQYLRYGGLALLLAAPGLIWAWILHPKNTPARKRILQLSAITFAFTAYEVIAGKFWLNHMFPSAYWSLLCGSLLLTIPTKNTHLWQKILAIILVIPCAWFGWKLTSLNIQLMQQAHNEESVTPNNWRARQVATYLRSQHLQPDDTVQVLDMAGDGQAALLMAQATSATGFLIDVPLWMEPNSAEIQTLRKNFLHELQQKNPIFIVYFEQFLHPGGGNRLKEFKPLYEWINANYEAAEQREAAYIIFRRKTASQ